jgi:predicted dienelactone hydrolase
MRLFEIIIPVLLGTYLLWSHPRPFTSRLFPAFAFIGALIHFGVEGYRWQMIPLYALTLLLTIISFRIDSKPLASYLTFGLLLLVTLVPILLPVPKIPTPSGDYQIGTKLFELVDTSRQELYSGTDEPRRFMIQAWYPADVKELDQQAPWMENAEIFAPTIAVYIDLPAYFLNHLALVDIPAYKNSAVTQADEKFPVILFSHGWNGFNAQNAGQALELASRGYIVIGIQHTYGAVVSVFPDGTIAANNPKGLPEDAEDPNYEEVANILAKQWAGDMAYVLNQLEGQAGEAGEFFSQRVDINRVGVYGHSTGGGAAIQFCATDPRCKSILGMDPFMRPVAADAIANGISQPAFFMFSQTWTDLAESKNNQLFNSFYPHLNEGIGVITITGTAHYDFSDLPLLSPIAPQLGLKGPLSGKRVTEIVNAYLIDFFELTLKNIPSDLFDNNFSDFEEVIERNKQ